LSVAELLPLLVQNTDHPVPQPVDRDLLADRIFPGKDGLANVGAQNHGERAVLDLGG